MMPHSGLSSRIKELVHTREAFSRQDESGDALFYTQDRFVDHLDEVALATVESLIGSLIVEEKPHILDLMAGWNSHIPASLGAERVVGLGLNRNELAQNPALILPGLERNAMVRDDVARRGAAACATRGKEVTT